MHLSIDSNGELPDDPLSPACADMTNLTGQLSLTNSMLEIIEDDEPITRRRRHKRRVIKTVRYNSSVSSLASAITTPKNEAGAFRNFLLESIDSAMGPSTSRRTSFVEERIANTAPASPLTVRDNTSFIKLTG
jgi:hypothetical protein